MAPEKVLERLRKLNPDIQVFGVRDIEFAKYGRVLGGYDTSEIVGVCDKIAQPESGSAYALERSEFGGLEITKKLGTECFGELDMQLGLCWGYNNYLNGLEYHKSSEINIAAKPLVLLLALQYEIENGRELDASKIKAFYVERGDIIEVYATSLHFCPCQTEDGGFSCVVGLHRGTNAPLDAKSQDPLLFRKNKWLICHDRNQTLIGKGVYPGIHGVNYRINY